MAFTPTAEEIVELMEHHARNETKAPIYSFGQGCEGEPLTESALIASAIRIFRSRGGKGTVNINSNASLPQAVADLAQTGLTSLRVSLNSAREEAYNRYHRPQGYNFSNVRESIRLAKAAGIFISLNLLYFPGFTDTELESAALIRLITDFEIDYIQLRNLNIDPEFYLELMQGIETGPCLGFANFGKRLKKECPWARIGYFNPPVAGQPAPA
jgi:uncharacterized Fe-S cluster-containing radical SAM superfamily enzyme